MADETHQHDWHYGGVKFEDGQDRVSGSSARERRYYDFFYCSICLDRRYDILSTRSTTYDEVLFNASPIYK